MGQLETARDWDSAAKDLETASWQWQKLLPCRANLLQMLVGIFWRFWLSPSTDSTSPPPSGWL